MKVQRSGVIINVTSQSGVQGFVGESAYCPSKYGLEGLTVTLALELALEDANEDFLERIVVISFCNSTLVLCNSWEFVCNSTLVLRN